MFASCIGPSLAKDIIGLPVKGLALKVMGYQLRLKTLLKRAAGQRSKFGKVWSGGSCMMM